MSAVELWPQQKVSPQERKGKAEVLWVPSRDTGQSHPPLAPSRCGSIHHLTFPFPLRTSCRPRLQCFLRRCLIPVRFTRRWRLLNTNSSTRYLLQNTCHFTDCPCRSPKAQPRQQQTVQQPPKGSRTIPSLRCNFFVPKNAKLNQNNCFKICLRKPRNSWCHVPN